MVICSVFLCLAFLTAGGVFSVDADDMQSVSVMEGENVTLHTDVFKQRDDKIMWYFGPENTFVARMNGKASSTMYSDDEMFRDRLKMNNQTGDLTITHITSHHSGLYTLKISSNNKVSYKTFNLTVSGESLLYKGNDISNTISKQTEDLDTDNRHTCSDSPPMWVIVAVVIALVICVIIINIIIVGYKRRRMSYKASVSETVYAPVSDKGSSMSSSSSEQSNSSMLPNEQEKKLMLY
ncbi:uncharacterized protein LOC130552392 [Triplophysa rosa]|uniref:Immunoglobulin domain-containing protein n=1 Tax=Triplophysa rosa TaxID=992332 RepID=A0A9W7WXX3_TRIRA|nr:uncharacterized protein LOC130552392 [Triplophysa rosa]KAI7810502.1 hypothetical protein IRJ41_002665 [Triplophysa rosa]